MKPLIINPILPFDATKNYSILFSVVSGSQVIANEVEIQKNSDNSQVYLKKIASFSLQHDISLNSLSNGNEYRIRLRTYDINNNYSEWSDWVMFWCFETPIVNISNIYDNKITNQTYTFFGNYIHSDILQSYKFYLYDSNKNLISYSSELFTDLNVPQYEFTNLENDELYYIELKTISIHQMEGTSGLIYFRPLYIAPKLYATLTAENLSDEGVIKISADIQQILGDIDSGTIEYLENEWIDLTNSQISFSQPFNINQSNFRLKVWCKNIINDEVFLILESDNGTIELMQHDNAIHAFKKMNNCNLVSHYKSNDLQINTGDNLVIEFKQISNTIELQMTKVVI